MTDKNYIRLRAKSLSVSGRYKINLLLIFCMGLYVFMSNIQVLLEAAVKNFPAQTSFLGADAFLIPCSFFALILSLFLLPMLKALREGWFIAKIKRKQAKWSNVFKLLKDAGILKFTSLYILLAGIKILWAIVFFMPSAVYLKVSLDIFESFEATPVTAFVLAAGFGMVFFIGAAALSCMLQRYFLCYYIAMTNADLRIRDILSQSKVICEGQCLKILFFKCRFIPYAFLCFFVFPCFYVYNYCKQSCALYAHELYKNRNKALDRTISFSPVG